MVDPAKAASVEASATRTLELSDRNACDVELLCVGGFSPLTGFMNAEAYDHVVENMRLPGSNLLFGLPIVLDTDWADSACPLCCKFFWRLYRRYLIYLIFF